MWSDPEDIDEWGVSPRGAGYLFGCEVVSQVVFFCSSLFIPYSFSLEYKSILLLEGTYSLLFFSF